MNEEIEQLRVYVEKHAPVLGTVEIPVPISTLRALLAETSAEPPAAAPLVCVFCVIDLKDAERRGIPEAERLPVHAARVVANGMTMCDVRHQTQPPPVSNGFLLPGNGQQLPPINGFGG